MDGMKNRKNLQVQLYGLGTIEGGGMAMLMKEVDGERLFPIFVPQHCRGYYSEMVRLTLASNGEQRYSLFTDHFASALGMEIRKVTVTVATDDTISTIVEVLSDYGGPLTFEAPMHQAVFYAYVRHLPIYIDSLLMEKMRGRVQIAELCDDPGEKEQEYAAVRQRLLSGVMGRILSQQLKPDATTLAGGLTSFTDYELRVLIDMSVDSEGYEWAKLFSDEIERRSQMVKQKNNTNSTTDEES